MEDPPPVAAGRERKPGEGMNPFAFGLPVLLMGFFLTMIFPPVGVALLGLGATACGVGLAMAIARSLRGRGPPKADRSTGDE